ncbi:diacylglycerol kinase [Neptunicella marina]|uniref:Diacylglycerol kinase n=1 Tax=Neptunicella marina TaxID=2125989 RepID=A0A8J6IYK8_9ALTE|nr:diacylglycerol kinase family protein [Neptunicella marina]MBC3767547.1 diacylglycerol kinase [Neptunicella marina]
MENNAADLKNQPFKQKLQFALQGLGYAFKQESNVRRHIFFGLTALILFAFVQPTAIWWALIVLVICLIIAAEILNSSIEAMLDHLHPDIHPTVGCIKDMLAAMVLLLSIAAGIIGVLALVDSI